MPKLLGVIMKRYFTVSAFAALCTTGIAVAQGVTVREEKNGHNVESACGSEHRSEDLSGSQSLELYSSTDKKVTAYICNSGDSQAGLIIKFSPAGVGGKTETQMFRNTCYVVSGVNAVAIQPKATSDAEITHWRGCVK